MHLFLSQWKTRILRIALYFSATIFGAFFFVKTNITLLLYKLLSSRYFMVQTTQQFLKAVQTSR